MIFLHEFFLALFMVRIFGDAVYRADVDALRFVKMTYALGAELRVDLINLFPLINRPVRTFGFADVTVDAFIGNNQGHRFVFPYA